MARKPTKEDFENGTHRINEIGRRLGSLFGNRDISKLETPGLGNFFGGLGHLIDQLQALSVEAEKAGGEITKNGEFDIGSDKRIRGVYGFTVKTALGEKGAKVESFGNIHKDEKSGRVIVEEIREPMTDIFDEPDYILVVAEVPGIRLEDVQLDLHEDIVILSADREATKYRKEILLPTAFSTDKMSYACRNGILEIRFTKH